MIEAILLNPSTRKRSARKSKAKKRATRRKKMAKRKMPKRNARGRFVKSGRKVKRRKRRNPVAKAVKRRRTSRKLTRKGPVSRSRRAAAKKGWRRRTARKKNWAKRRGTRMVGGRRKYLRNPFAIGGRKGKFNLIPEMKSIKAAATKGAGALLSDLVKSTAYSTLLAKFRPSGPTSVAENTVASLVSGALTGALAGYIGGAKMAADFVEGAYTVTLYKVVADAFARATGGKAKLFGFVSNPFTSVPTMPILPGVKFGTGQSVAETNGVSGIIPEGNVLPLGGIIPEGNVIPLGAYELDPAEMPDRYRSRF